jgi:hypothetical protein
MRKAGRRDGVTPYGHAQFVSDAFVILEEIEEWM